MNYRIAESFDILYGNDLIPADLNLPANQYAADDKLWNGVVTASSFLPRVQLFGGNSEAAKQGQIQVGRYGLVRQKDQVIDLSNQFDCIPINWRFKAMRLANGSVYNYHNPESPDFRQIIEESAKPDAGCMYGVEFLIWVPSEECFATFFLNSKTARREAPNLKNLLRNAATLKVQFIKKQKYSWHGPVVTPCSTPITVLPTNEEIIEQNEKFIKVKDSEVEKATTTESSNRER